MIAVRNTRNTHNGILKRSLICKELRIDREVLRLAGWLRAPCEIGWPVFEPRSVRNGSIRIVRVLYHKNIATINEVHNRKQDDKDNASNSSHWREPEDPIQSNQRFSKLSLCVFYMASSITAIFRLHSPSKRIWPRDIVGENGTSHHEGNTDKKDTRVIEMREGEAFGEREQKIE